MGKLSGRKTSELVGVINEPQCTNTNNLLPELMPAQRQAEVRGTPMHAQLHYLIPLPTYYSFQLNLFL